MKKNNKFKLYFFMPSCNGGGAERVMIDIANAAAEKNYDITLILIHHFGEYLNKISPKVKLISCNKTKRKSIARLWQNLKALVKLICYIKKHNPIAVISTLTEANTIAILAKLLTNYQGKMIIRIANTLSIITQHSRKKIFYLFSKKLYQKADEVIAVSGYVKNDLITNKFTRKATHIYNPVPIANILKHANQAPPHPWFKNTSFKTVVAIGRLAQQKDYPTLLRAFAKLIQHSSARLLILGCGTEKPKLLKLSKNLGIQNVVCFTGFVSNPFSYLQHADLYALSSLYEGSPNTIAQAMIIGTPIVCTDCPGASKELLDAGKYGLLSSIGDVNTLKENMLQQLKHPIPAHLLKARGKLLFDFEKNLQRYLDLAHKTNP